MKRFARNLIVAFGTLLFLGGIIGLIIFIATFSNAISTYIGLGASSAAVAAGLIIAHSVTDSWGETVAAIADVFLFGWWT